jgi:hypothetical protein
MIGLGETFDFWCGSSYKIASRLTENAHLPFDKLTALSKVEGPFGKLMVLSSVEGLRYPHPPPC